MYGDFAEEEVDKIMAAADIDGSGEIDYSEWLAATTNRKNLLSEEKLQHAFSFFDSDGSGNIDLNEIIEIIGVKKNLVDAHVYEEIIAEVDTNGDGVIDFEEFKVMMQKLTTTEQLRKSSTGITTQLSTRVRE